MRVPLLLALCAAALPAVADDIRPPRTANPAYVEECGSCHLAYPPALLAAADWRAMMKGLEKHFGSNATLDEPQRGAILVWLERNAAGDAAKHSAASLRITETRWFRREHDEIAPAIFRHAKVGSAANCAACHRDAAAGVFDEDSIVMPGGHREARR
jgi:hypothetical protein